MKNFALVLLMLLIVGCTGPTYPNVKIPPEIMIVPTPLQKL
jgi:hypothetical protein